MKIVCFLLVSCAVFMAASGTPQVFYTPFVGHLNSSGRQYYAVEYLGNAPQHPPGPDYNLNHGEVDGPNEDDDSVDENMQNFFYNNGFEEIANDEELDSSVMPYDVNPASHGESIPEAGASLEGDNDDEDVDDDDNQEEVVIDEFSNDKGNENPSISEESSTESPLTEENTESSIELETNSSSTTDLPDKIIPAFVHPIHKPSSEWPLEAIQQPMNNLKRKQKPHKGHRKRIRIIKKRRGNPKRPNMGIANVNTSVNKYNKLSHRPGSSNHGSNSCASCQCGVTTTRRIIGGQVAAVNEFPWLALITYNATIQCGGTLINDRYVLTAAHCVRGFDMKLFQLRFSEYNTDSSTDTVLVQRRIARIHSLNSYDVKTSDNDIAILRLSRPINFETTTVRPICLPPRAMDFTGKTGIIAGWGTTAEGGTPSNILRTAKVPIISNQQCLLIGMKITSNMLCAGRLLDGGIDACQGDSGGPLMVVRNKRYHLAGIVSWGDGCARPLKPGIYTRVAKYLPWINRLTTGSCKCR